jgi:hypothetical protein
MRIVDLTRIAERELPLHDCSLRRDILFARAELAHFSVEDAKSANFPPNMKNIGSHDGSQQFELETVVPAKVPNQPESSGAIYRARAILEVLLKSGPCPSSEIFAAAVDASISVRTMQRAADELGVVRIKSGFGGCWVWSMPKMPERV